MNDWGSEFAEHMPPEILAAIRLARAGGDGTIATRPGATPRGSLRVAMANRSLRSQKGGHLHRAAFLGRYRAGHTRRTPVVRRDKSSSGTQTEAATAIQTLAAFLASRTRLAQEVAAQFRTYRRVTAADVDPGMIAAWQPNDPEYPEGSCC